MGEKKSSMTWLWILLGFFGVVGGGVVVCCGGCYFAANYGMQKAGEGLSAIGDEIQQAFVMGPVRNSAMSDGDKQLVEAEIDRLFAVEDPVAKEKASSRASEIANSPLVPAAVTRRARDQYVATSGLTGEEKTAAKLTFNRVIRGVMEESIPSSSLNGINSLRILEEKEVPEETYEDGERVTKMVTKYVFRESMDDDMLKEYIAELKVLADDNSVPEEDYQFNLGAETKKRVDQLLAQ